MSINIVYWQNKEKDVLCPLILFIDKTHPVTKGSLTLEPVCLTLGIFNKRPETKKKRGESSALFLL
jgi:hypothetical protein